jgi:hypothetical protein
VKEGNPWITAAALERSVMTLTPEILFDEIPEKETGSPNSGYTLRIIHGCRISGDSLVG